MSAHDPVALRRHPKLGLAVLGDIGKAGVRFDIALMNGLGLELALDDDVRLGEALFDVAELEFDTLGDVGGRVRRRVNAGCDHVLVQKRCVRAHRFVDVEDVRQHLILDFDELQGLLRNAGAGGRDRCNRMAFVKDFLAGHDVAHEIAVVDQHFACRHELRRLIREIIARDDSLHAGEGGGFRRINALDPRVRVRAAQNFSDELPGQIVVSAKARTPSNLVDAIRTNGPCADHFQVSSGLGVADSFLHGSGPPHLGGCVQHGTNDFVIARASAEIAGQPVAHLCLCRIGIAIEKRLRGNEKSGSADAAL